METEADKEIGKCHDLTDDFRNEQNDKRVMSLTLRNTMV